MKGTCISRRLSAPKGVVTKCCVKLFLIIFAKPAPCVTTIALTANFKAPTTT